MTFAEKLIRLRRSRGLSQEALAESLGVSRQAVSRWEQGAALPDGGKLLPCARYFGVSVDWLLDDALDWAAQTEPDREPAGERPAAARTSRRWYLAGGIAVGTGGLGMVAMGVLSAIFPVTLSEAPVGAEWVRVYTGLLAFLKEYHVEWLFAMWAAFALAGLWLLAQPYLRRRSAPGIRLSPRYAAGLAAAAYGCGQAAWWVQQGKSGDTALMWLFLAAAIFCAVQLYRGLTRDADGRRKGGGMVLLYAAAHGVIQLLTAEAGIGLVGLALHIGVCLITVSALREKRPG